MERTRATDTAVFFIAGGLIGAGLAILFAPQSGRELRGRIGDGLRAGAERGRELRDRAAEKGRELIEGARQGLAWQRERLAAAVDAGRETFREEKSQG
jgi:gas vesicle protein